MALLAVAKQVVDFLAFSCLPLKYIYKQYRTIDVRSVWFCCLMDGWTDGWMEFLFAVMLLT